MKKLTEFIPLFTGFSTALLLVAAMAQPAVAGGVAGGTKTCNSWLDGVFTFETAPVHKKCWGGWDGCLTSISRLYHTSVNYAVIDFREPGFEGNVSVAVLSNDSRLGPPTTATAIGAKKLGMLPNGAGLTNWYIPFTGLKPEHYYTVVIYSPDPGYGIHKPFSRQCFLTTKHPDDCPEDAYRSRDGTKRC